MASVDPMEAWVSLVRETTPIIALVNPARVVYEQEQIRVDDHASWIIVANRGMGLHAPFYEGQISLTIVAEHGHVSQQIQQAIIDNLADVLLGFRVHRVSSGNQAGAIVSVGKVIGLYRGRLDMPEADLPFRAITLESKISTGAMAWT